MLYSTRVSLVAALLLALAPAAMAQPVRSGWITSPGAGQPAGTALAGVLPDVHSVDVEGDVVTVRSAGISIHNLSPFQSPPVPVERLRRFEFRIPADPRPAAANPVSVRPDILGVFLNGQPIYNYFEAASYQGQNIWRYDMVARNDDGVVTVGGSPRPGLEHRIQLGLLSRLIEPSGKHSPILGYAFDGSPVYGPWGFVNHDGSGGVQRMRSSYRMRSISTRTQWPDGTELTVGQAGPPVGPEFPLGAFVEDYAFVPGSGDLDRFNGRFSATPEYPEGVYAYFLSVDKRGRLAYPYLIGAEYRGQVSPGGLDAAVIDQEAAEAAIGVPLSRRNADQPGPQLRFSAGPENIAAGEPAVLSFQAIDASGDPIRSLEFVHERPIHLLVVSDDLSLFDHIHPELRAGNRYVVQHVFPRAGAYQGYADYTAPGQAQRVESFQIHVGGQPVRPQILEADTELSAAAGPIRVELSSAAPLVTGQDIELAFRVRDVATGKRIPDMQPFLGAWGHFVLIAEGHGSFIHAHPMEENAGGTSGGIGHSHIHGAGSEAMGPPPSEIRVLTNFANPGVYKLWAQFGVNDAVVTVPFVLRVKAGEASTSESAPIPAGATLIRISSTGFEPSKVAVDAGSPTTLAFSRSAEPNCGSAVVFPALGLRTEVPLGGVAVVELPSELHGEVSFSCGMGMYRGAIVAGDPNGALTRDGP